MSHPVLHALRRTGTAAALAALTLGTSAQAAPVGSFDFIEFGGPLSGLGDGGLLFSPDDGIGGWIGRLATGVLPGIGLAGFDTLATFFANPILATDSFGLTGEFTFVFDDVTGLTPGDDLLTGKLEGVLDLSPTSGLVRLVYAVTGGTGLFAGFTGTGTSGFSFTTLGGEPFSYSGAGELTLVGPAAVPVPGTLALAALGLLAAAGVAGSRRNAAA